MVEADRRMIHSDAHIQLDLIYGKLLARFYKRSLLERAFEAIPKPLLPSVVGHDHAIIYYETWKLSDRVKILPNAVYHNEPTTVLELGKRTSDMKERSTRMLIANGYYNDFMRRETHLRKTGTRKMICDKLLSLYFYH
jgi:hypothetical protein